MSGSVGLSLVETLIATLDQAPFILGNVLFSGFEVPSRISIGGAHAVTIHKLPGGGRVIDAMGVDDAGISWSGFFTGADAAARARYIDAMRQSGSQVQLSFGDYVFNVVVVRFEYDIQDRGALISYRIRTERVTEGLSLQTTSLAGLLTSLVSDLASASGYVALSSSAASISSITAAQLSASAVNDPSSSSGLAAVALALQAAGAELGQNISGQASLLPLGNGEESLGLTSAVGLGAATSAAGSLAASVQAAGYLNRACQSSGQLAGSAQLLPLLPL